MADVEAFLALMGNRLLRKHKQCYGSCENWQKSFITCCNSPNSPKLLSPKFFTVWYMSR